jgi:hypothetical protein
MVKTYRINEKIVFREEADGAFLFDPADGNLKYLNHSGKEIYQTLKRVQDTTSVIAALEKTYPDADRDRLKTDVMLFIDQMVQHNFIAIDSSPSDV